MIWWQHLAHRRPGAWQVVFQDFFYSALDVADMRREIEAWVRCPAFNCSTYALGGRPAPLAGPAAWQLAD